MSATAKKRWKVSEPLTVTRDVGGIDEVSIQGDLSVYIERMAVNSYFMSIRCASGESYALNFVSTRQTADGDGEMQNDIQLTAARWEPTRKQF